MTYRLTKRELAKDLEKAVEFDQSSLFKKIYEEEYGILGGHPFGMMVGDYDFGRTAEDVGALQKIAVLRIGRRTGVRKASRLQGARDNAADRSRLS